MTMNARLSIPRILPVVLCLLLAGCGILPDKTAISTFVLDARAVPQTARHPLNKVLLVGAPRAEPGFDSTLIAYTRAPLTLDYYSKSQWADTPARMLAPLLVGALDGARAFRAVIAAPTAADADLRLDVTLILLQQEFFAKPSQTRVALRASLIDLKTSRVLMAERYEALEPAPSEDAFGGVRAANTALGKLLREISASAIKAVR